MNYSVIHEPKDGGDCWSPVEWIDGAVDATREWRAILRLLFGNICHLGKITRHSNIGRYSCSRRYVTKCAFHFLWLSCFTTANIMTPQFEKTNISRGSVSFGQRNKELFFFFFDRLSRWLNNATTPRFLGNASKGNRIGKHRIKL